MKIIAVCGKCGYRDEDPNLEINFKDNKIYYVCSECFFQNDFKQIKKHDPLPRPRRI